MGFLDNTTNNIILDAVLTDVGRRILAEGRGSFSVFKFALGDDDVNYGLISKFGRTLGKEKIEKNTPVLEATTNEAYAQKFKLVSLPNPNLYLLPTFTLSGPKVATSGNSVSLTRATEPNTTVTFTQNIATGDTILFELRDQVFQVELSSLFLEINGSQPISSRDPQRVRYTLPKTREENGKSILEFQLRLKTITDAMFSVYGTPTAKTKITTYVRVTGVQSGTVKEFAVDINKT